MLSSLAKASGTNLQVANHIVLLDPAGHNPKHGAALERQAMGRCVRIGQSRMVTVTRFIVENTLESELFRLNEEAAAAARVAEEADAAYVCEQPPDQTAASLSATSSKR